MRTNQAEAHPAEFSEPTGAVHDARRHFKHARQGMNYGTTPREESCHNFVKSPGFKNPMQETARGELLNPFQARFLPEFRRV